MINTYETYLEQPDRLKLEEAMSIYKQMVECFKKCTFEDKMEYWNEFLKKAADYTGVSPQGIYKRKTFKALETQDIQCIRNAKSDMKR